MFARRSRRETYVSRAGFLGKTSWQRLKPSSSSTILYYFPGWYVEKRLVEVHAKLMRIPSSDLVLDLEAQVQATISRYMTWEPAVSTGLLV
ncbi:MAG: hypothetical protein QHI38_08225 [Armatimonadota bacterium]|nr:hypothetical protein [Armatimonadota bacterium]